ncbi:MAG: pantetheine-phosphate adenylyltransferase [Bacteroidales bacterium]|nr:pantetheine-phosphate adenylyltransferase [Bacteroidales bacterium]
MRTAIFPGSFDPFTLGHLDVLESALKIFDKVIVAVGYNSSKLKSGFFPVDLRMKIIADATKAFGKRVEVCCYKELTIELCRKMDVKFIVRGLRTTTDFEFEGVIAQANKVLDPSIVTVYVQASHEFSFISSTVVRDVLMHNGDATPFMPKGVNIKKYLTKRKETVKQK